MQKRNLIQSLSQILSKLAFAPALALDIADHYNKLDGDSVNMNRLETVQIAEYPWAKN